MKQKDDQNKELPEIGEIRRLMLAPDERLVISYPTRVPAEAFKHIKEGMAAALGIDVARIIVLDSDPTLTAFKATPDAVTPEVKPAPETDIVSYRTLTVGTNRP